MNAIIEGEGQVLNPTDLPRVLLVSVNPLSASSNNGKTYASFFAGYPRAKIAQLYFHRELPSSDVCDRYFRISDEDVIRFAVGRVRGLGAPVGVATISEQFFSPNVTRKLAASEVIRLVRSRFLRSVHRRGYESVRGWLAEFQPQVIFFSGGDATYLYPLVERIATEFDARIVNYVTDDYVLPAIAGGPMSWLARRIVRRHFLRVCERSALVLTIGDKMSREYSRRYGIRSTPIMNLVPANSAPQVAQMRPDPDCLVFTYAGGLHFNRWKTLLEIGQSLDRLAKNGLSAVLNIYTASTLSSRILGNFRSCRSIRIHDAVDSGELNRIYASSDVLVHAESFGRRDRASTRLSISTKIPEYLASGRCILAVGPREVASVEYLETSKSAFVATSLSHRDLDAVIVRVARDGALRNQLLRNAQEVLKSNHDGDLMKRRLWRRLVSLASPSSVGSVSSISSGGQHE